MLYEDDELFDGLGNGVVLLFVHAGEAGASIVLDDELVIVFLFLEVLVIGICDIKVEQLFGVFVC